LANGKTRIDSGIAAAEDGPVPSGDSEAMTAPTR
jgi:hypothetical protein